MTFAKSAVLEEFADQVGITVEKITSEERLFIGYVVSLLKDAYSLAGYRPGKYSEAHRVSAEDASRWAKIHANLSQAIVEANDAPPAILRAIDERRGIARIEFYNIVDCISEFLKRVEPDGLSSRELGRPRNDSLELAIYHLAWLFEARKRQPAKAPSRKTGTGPFFRFCEAIFNAAEVGELARHSETAMREVCVPGYRPPAGCFSDRSGWEEPPH